MYVAMALASGADSGVWVAPEMPDWAVPAAFTILIAVYALIVFYYVHPYEN